MSTRLIFAAALLTAAAPVAAQSTPASPIGAGEIGYPVGSLGYDALMTGDLATAARQLERSTSVAPDDPARLINLGYVHMQEGRLVTARTLFEAVRDSDRHFLIETASGDVADTRDVARRALRRLQRVSASR